MTRFSYVMATRNRVAVLERVLANVREFLTPEDEFLVIDGASGDGTVEFIEQHRDVITDYVSERDVSESHALNKGILRARGRYIKLLTDDDYTVPAAIPQIAAVLEAHPEIDALQCGGEHWRVDADGTKSFKYHAYFPPNAGAFRADPGNAYRGLVACGLGLFFARRIVAQVGLLDTSYAAMDSEFIERLLAHRIDYRFLSVLLYRHTTYAYSISANQAKIQRDRLRLALRALSFAPSAAEPTALQRLGAELDLTDAELERLLRALAKPGRRSWLQVGQGIVRAGKAAWRLWEQARPAAPPKASIEPSWDGSLR